MLKKDEHADAIARSTEADLASAALISRHKSFIFLRHARM